MASLLQSNYVMGLAAAFLDQHTLDMTKRYYRLSSVKESKQDLVGEHKG